MINKFLLVLLENRDSSSPFVICNCWLTDLQPEMVECKQQSTTPTAVPLIKIGS